jgi:hypothetical protein
MRVAICRAEIEKLFGDLSGTVSRIQHHSAYFNVIQQSINAAGRRTHSSSTTRTVETISRTHHWTDPSVNGSFLNQSIMRINCCGEIVQMCARQHRK